MRGAGCSHVTFSSDSSYHSGSTLSGPRRRPTILDFHPARVLLAPFVEDLERVTTIPGVKQRTAEVVIAEIGVDMRVFPSAGHLASWAPLCPGNNESAGKHRSGKTRRGNPWLRTALTEAALGAIRHGRGRWRPATVASCATAATRRP
jgi:transposase